ncbi:hypothetical protein M422DRAFT_211260 [Sphaerobolus stellatus SS14]|uniref:Uncharacterized protein n=1 Tax=Sphaerobolus stellatus (strain SS14) TaxID=990650 RepID=A0A0C9VJI1_SPHS4|nr:hypothetical protein M422DRAFT_211260 [Sphaerobolus stellatus SS14]
MLTSHRSLSRSSTLTKVVRNAHQLTIGLRKEDSTRLWERRCPLSPAAVEELTKDAGVKVVVQDCDRRVFSTGEFEKAGAHVQEDLSSAHIILGIKEIPLPELKSLSPLSHRQRTHFMFSHTGKGQSYNMPLLSEFVQLDETNDFKKPDRLIDYEFLTDGPAPAGKRVVAFGWFAGATGAVEGLCASAHDFLSFGVASPFLYLPRPYMCRTVEGMRDALRAVGTIISEKGTPAVTGPFVITVTGNGNVATGALSILKELPHALVKPEDLPTLVTSKDTDLKKVYIVHVKAEHYLVSDNNPSSIFDRASYYSRPSEWKSAFHEKIAPYATLLINGAGWQPGFPRLMTNEQLFQVQQRSRNISSYGRFRTVADVSCDVNGGLEFVDRSTTIDSPFYTALPTGAAGIQIMSVDILPSQVPQDASEHFSRCLMPYVRTLIRQYEGNLRTEDTSRLHALDRATIARDGKLQGNFTRLTKPLQEHLHSPTTPETVQGSPQRVLSTFGQQEIRPEIRKKILLLGTGMVARPAVEEFYKRKDVQLIVASNNIAEASYLKTEFPDVIAKEVDLTDISNVESLINEVDIVVSLLPVAFHPTVAKLCIARRKHMVTASYISPVMKELNDSAIQSDVLLLNEIGLDPGIDHCSAISLLRRLRLQNKTVKSFISFCGGLPAPEAADVPLAYKFSWSPRGVLGAALNSARFKLAGQEYNVHGKDLLQSYFPSVPLSKYLKLEGIANRDSLSYAGTYELGPIGQLETILRGTLRYPGFSSLLHSFKRIGLLDTERPLQLQDWSNFASRSLATKFAIRIDDNDLASFCSALSDILDMPKDRLTDLLHALSWLGISPMSKSSPPIPLPTKALPPIDLLTLVLSKQLKYNENEHDMVVLMHELTVSSPLSKSNDPSLSARQLEETHTSTLIAYGTPTSSAMARTVGLPVAFATLSVLDGKVRDRGVCGPTSPEVYESVLEGMEIVGLGMKEAMYIGPGSGLTLERELKSTIGGV